MNKNIVMGYSSFDVDVSKNLDAILVELLAADESVITSMSVAPGTTSTVMDVASGKGYKVRVTNLDQDGLVINMPVLTNSFDVVAPTHPIEIVTSVSVS